MDRQEDGDASEPREGSVGAPASSLAGGGRARIAVMGGTAAALGLGTADARLRAHGAVLAEVPGGLAVTGAALQALAAADVAVLVLGADGFSSAARQLSLLAWHLGGCLPLIVTGAAGPEAAEAVAAYAMALGAPVPAAAADPRDLPGLLDVALGRRASQAAAAPLRLRIESVSAGGDKVTGRIVAGVATPGLEVVVLPQAAQAVVQRSEPADADGGGVTIQMDRPVSAAAGQVLAAAGARPEHADQVAAHVAWLADAPLLPGRPYRLRLGGQSVTAQISALKHRIDAADLSPIAARRLAQGEAGLCNLSLANPLLFDAAPPGQPAGGGLSRFTIEDPGTGNVLGAGRVLFTLRRATNIHWQALAVDKAARAALKAQRPCCLWFTGLSGSGKSTVASLLEQRLSAIGRHTYTLDGDNVRHGLNRDLGFTDADRVENIRRVAEVARLMVDAGLIVMVSFISPFRTEREMARASVLGRRVSGDSTSNTPIDICESRDPKGLYKKARAGQLKNFTGIDSPYEPPERAEISLASGTLPAEALVEQVLSETCAARADRRGAGHLRGARRLAAPPQDVRYQDGLARVSSSTSSPMRRASSGEAPVTAGIRSISLTAA